jgi:sugar-specific transcriptional regulator TrmB
MLSQSQTDYNFMKQNNLILQKLQDIGLSEAEARLYLVGLELGPTTILNLSKVSEIKRTTIYGMIDNLVSKGIFEIQIDGWKKLYTASSPQNLQNLIQKNYQNLLTIIPQLESINVQDKEEIYLKTHSGSDNLANLYHKVLNQLEPNSEYLIIGNTNIFETILPEFAHQFFTERARICMIRNITIRALFVDNLKAREQLKHQTKLNIQIKLLPKITKLNTNYVITNNIAVFHQTVEFGNAFETNNPHIIETQQELFNLLWGNN